MRPSCRGTSCFLALIIGVGVFYARDVEAQQANVFIRIDNAFHACQLPVSVGVHTATVEVYAHPFRTVRFQALVPAGTIFFGDTSGPGIAVIGNSQSGVSIEMPSCTTTFPTGGPVGVLSITFFAPAALPSVTWEVQPFPGESDIGLADCDFFPMKGTGEYSIYCDPASMIGPYKPYPPDGAVDVPLDVALNLVGQANLVGVADHPIQWPYEGNIYYCETAYLDPYSDCVFPLDPGELLPNTTYHWRAYNVCCCCEHGDFAAGDVWSFTTGDGTLATQQSTWGYVKALYRD